MFSYLRSRSAAIYLGVTALVAIGLTLLALGFTSDSAVVRRPEPTEVRPRVWQTRWDAEVGLWWQEHPGHTAPVRDLDRTHPAPSAAARLLLAAQARQLGSVDVTAVLTAIRRMQTLNGGGRHHGELRWYWEETGPVDHNGSFFTAMSLLGVHFGHGDQLTAAQRQALLTLFKDLRVWFDAQAETRDFFYPNRCLGDLVCAWLLGEATGAPDPDGRLRQTMLDAAAYWTEHDWGWGEHMSDIYGGICLDELSALLLFSKQLPADVRRAYEALFQELLALDDAFGDMPRVPAVRTYAFTASPQRIRYRDTVRPLPKHGGPLPHPATPVMPPEVGDVFRHRAPMGATLHERGWQKMAPPPAADGGTAKTDVLVPCHDGVVAAAHLAPDVRVGSLSRFPLMRDKDHSKWGMSWQTAPVALRRRAGDWGFLQWEAREGDRVRAHPANDILTGYKDNALCADDAEAVAAVGQTFALQRGGDLLVLRRMPVVPTRWDALADRFRFLDVRAAPSTSSTPDGGGHRLTLRYGSRAVGVHCMPLSPGARIELNEHTSTPTGRAFDWGAVFHRDALDTLDTVTVVWGISVNGPIDTVPRIVPLEPAAGSLPAGHAPFELHWDFPSTQWRVRIALDQERPLEDLAPAASPNQK